MKKPKYLKTYNFNDFPAKCYLKTYLGNRVLTMEYDGNKVCLWLENNTFIKDFPEKHLQISSEEITNIVGLFQKHIHIPDMSMPDQAAVSVAPVSITYDVLYPANRAGVGTTLLDEVSPLTFNYTERAVLSNSDRTYFRGQLLSVDDVGV